MLNLRVKEDGDGFLFLEEVGAGVRTKTQTLAVVVSSKTRVDVSSETFTLLFPLSVFSDSSGEKHEENMPLKAEEFQQPLEGLFRDGIPAPVLRAFAPLYQVVPFVAQAVQNARDCYFWRANPMRCLDQDVDVVVAYSQASEASFRLCPQQSATLLKCNLTEPARATFFCRDEEWEWRSCLMDKTGIHFRPYANVPMGSGWSNGGQTEDFHVEDRVYYSLNGMMQRKHIMNAVRERDLEIHRERKNWRDAAGTVQLGTPEAKALSSKTIAPTTLEMAKH